MSGLLGLDRRRRLAAARSFADRRRWRRISLPLEGRFLAPDGTEHDCRLEDISPGGARLSTAWLVERGATVVANIAGLGRLEGDVARSAGNGFAMRLHAGPKKRERLAEELTWLHNQARLGLDQRAGRRTPRSGRARLRLEDGATIEAELLDISITGMSFRCSRRPAVGAAVAVGKLSGVVARHHDEGFAIQLDPPDAYAEPDPEAA